MKIYEATVHKWWICPCCGGDVLCLLWGVPHLNPLDYRCPICYKFSPIPWREARVYSWTCSVCAHVQLVGVRTWDSEKKLAQVMWEYGIEHNVSIYCQVCRVPPVGPGLTAWHQFWNGVSNTTKEYQTERKSKIRADTAAFDHWVAYDLPGLIVKRNEERRRQEKESRLRELAKQQQMQTLDGLRLMDATEFEKAVGSLYLAQGWGVFVTPRSGDRGIDLVLIKDSRKLAVQCKKYKAKVSEPLVREFYGSFVGHFAGGVFVTTSSYSPACVEWAKKRKSRLTLVNGETLASLMAEHKPPRVDKFELWQGRA